MNMLWEWIGLGVGYFLLRQLLRGQHKARAIVVVMIGLATAMSCYGLEQYFVSLPADRERYAVDPEGALRDAGLFAPPGSRQRFLFEQRVNSTEPMGTFALANSLAGFLAPGWWPRWASACRCISSIATRCASRWGSPARDC